MIDNWYELAGYYDTEYYDLEIAFQTFRMIGGARGGGRLAHMHHLRELTEMVLHLVRVKVNHPFWYEIDGYIKKLRIIYTHYLPLENSPKIVINSKYGN